MWCQYFIGWWRSKKRQERKVIGKEGQWNEQGNNSFKHLKKCNWKKKSIADVETICL